MAEYTTVTNGQGLTTFIVVRDNNSPVLFAYDESADYEIFRTQLEAQGVQVFVELLANDPDTAFETFCNG